VKFSGISKPRPNYAQGKQVTASVDDVKFEPTLSGKMIAKRANEGRQEIANCFISFLQNILQNWVWIIQD
jgi:hypothetical protein